MTKSPRKSARPAPAAPSSPATPDRTFWGAALLALALVRGALWAAYLRTPIPFGPISDSWVYLDLARHWNTTGSWPQEAAFHSPLYPVLVAPLLRLGGNSLIPLLLLQNLLGIGSSMLILVWVRRFAASRWVAWAVLGILCSASPWFSHEWRLFPVTAAITMQFVLLEILYRLHRRTASTGSWRAVTGLGALSAVVLGLLVLLRPNFMLLVPVLAVSGALAVRRRTLPAVVPVLWVVVPALLALPFLLRNHDLGAGWSLSANSGITFYQGNNPIATGGYSRIAGVSSDVTRQNTDTRRTLDGTTLPSIPAADRYWWRTGVAYLASHPVHAAGLWGRKLLLFLGPVETGGDIPFSFERRRVPALIVFGLVGFSFVLGLGITGLAALPRPPFPRLALVALLAVPVVTSLVFYTATRYRLTAWPLMILLAGFGLEEIRRLFMKRRQGEPTGRRLLVHAGLAVAGTAATVGGLLAPPSLSARIAGWSNWGIAATTAGRQDDAIRAFTELRTLDPDNRENLESLGLAYLKSRRLPEAQACFQDLVQRHPDSFAGFNNLAYVHLAQGQWRPALEAARRALALRPEEQSASFILAEAAVRLRRFDEACRALANITQFPQAYDHLRRVKEQCERVGAGGSAPGGR